MKFLGQELSLNGSWFCSTVDPETASSASKPRVKKVTIPRNWEMQGFHNYDGSLWYYTEFELPEDETPQSAATLHFDGVDYFTEVYWNGKLLGKHEGYFQSFSFNVMGLLQKKNRIVVKVTSPREEPGTAWPLRKELIKGIFNHHDCRPGGWNADHGQDRNTGGIWNSVSVRFHKACSIGDLKISSRIKRQSAEIIISGIISNYTGLPVEENLLCMITAPDGRSILETFAIRIPGREKQFRKSVVLTDPKLWWSWDLGEQPVYEVSISGEKTDEVRETFGIRQVTLAAEKTFYLNGKRLFLRGTNIIPEQMLSKLTPEKIARQVALMKEANINIVRVHAHVCRQEFYDACDAAGILVWQDFPLQWTYSESEVFAENAVEQIGDMVKQLYNHCSIAFWCCHNEPGEQIHTLDERLYARVAKEDSTRIIRKASNYEEHPYDGWYWGNKEHYAATPMGPLVTEFGAQALPEVSSLQKFLDISRGFPVDWKEWEFHNFQPKQTFCVAQVEKGESISAFVANSQKYQSEVLQTAIDFYRRKKHQGITGIFQFMFIDCWESITWSVVDYYFKKKSGFNTLKKAFSPLYLSLKPMRTKHIAGDEVQLSFWVINDLHQSFHESVVEFYLDKKKVYSYAIPSIEADSVQQHHFEQVRFLLSKEIAPGHHEIDVRLKESNTNKVLATNTFTVEIITL